MKRMLLLIFALLQIKTVTGQNQSLILPNGYYKVLSNLSGTLPTNNVSTSYQGVPPEASYPYPLGPSNMYSKTTGDPLFFIVDGHIFNSYGSLISRLTTDPTAYSYLGLGYGWGENLIVPNPSNCSQYYIFSTDKLAYGQLPPQGCFAPMNVVPYYALIDMSVPIVGGPVGEKGANVTPNPVAGGNMSKLFDLIPSNPYWYPLNYDIHYGVSQVLPGNYRILVVSDNSRLHIFKIIGSGATPIQYVNSIEMTSTFGIGGCYSNCIRSEMEVYTDIANSKLKLAFAAPTIGIYYPPGGGSVLYNVPWLVLGELDYNGNFLSGSNKLIKVAPTSSSFTEPHLAGIEFSPDGNWVYCTHNSGPGAYSNPVEAINYSTPTNRIPILPVGVNMNDFAHSQIELSVDRKLYFVTSNRLARIDNPNNPGSYIWTNSVQSLVNYPLVGDYYNPANTQLQMYFLPDQLDGENYNMPLANPTCCNTYAPFTIEKEFHFPSTFNGTVNANAVVTGTDS